MKRLAACALAGLAGMAGLAMAPAMAVELSGAIRSSTGALPPDMRVLAEGEQMGAPIVGKIENGRYRIDLPDTGRYHLMLRADGWDAPQKAIWNPKKTGALDFLVYPEEVPEPALAAELIELGRQDQALRNNPKAANPDAAFAKHMAQEDKAREQRLGAIVDAKGWPQISAVGPKAASAAWVVAQHGSIAFLKRCLPLMQAASDKLEMNPQELALSIDRARVESGKPQVYGSQLHDGKGGKLELDPIEDRAHVDDRRAGMGMEPLADYLARFGI
jgi:hypothetical protein